MSHVTSGLTSPCARLQLDHSKLRQHASASTIGAPGTPVDEEFSSVSAAAPVREQVSLVAVLAFSNSCSYTWSAFERKKHADVSAPVVS